ncbi:Transposase, IS4 [Candidatus Thiomargarita nelsonii]|uniref:Transposase, IS4 n=1 Tax=Candidatus Thiomargarita nelsonii TaxID=1003181 RepID=A0A0A6P228_9GAMM|nr:Transposase, IS4 [Candidatus Thiomargarita nelsonii]
MTRDLKPFFLNPSTARQRQYEAIRAIVLENLPMEVVSKKFGYTMATLYSLIRDAKSGKLNLYPQIPKGPKSRRTPEAIQQLIEKLRTEKFSVEEIREQLVQRGYKVSVSTIERILGTAGYSKWPRRTLAQRGQTKAKTEIPERTRALDFTKLVPFNIECPTVGVFFFLPYIIEAEIIPIIQHCQLPESSVINARAAALSMLLLKLIGSKRLSHMSDFDHEPGLGVFAGLNVLPKATYMQSYSCRTSETLLLEFQNRLVKHFQEIYPHFYGSTFINLDFHSIPHFGEESQMEKVWCGARGKAMKGANTIFVQDSNSNAIVYTRADILRQNESTEILKFVDYWKSIKKEVKETLVFDCKFTSYKILNELMKDNINFITLRKRSKTLLENTSKISDEEWQKVTKANS